MSFLYIIFHQVKYVPSYIYAIKLQRNHPKPTENSTEISKQFYQNPWNHPSDFLEQQSLKIVYILIILKTSPNFT